MNNSKYNNIYQKRIYHIQDYICLHLEQKLTLENLAKKLNQSPFHFHRLFKLIAKENLYEFIKRIRLEKSCAMLISKENIKIIHIALSCGFSTSSAFSKAFKSHFQVTPSNYRKCYFLNNSKNGTLNSNTSKEAIYPFEYISDSELQSLINRRKNMNVTIESIPKYRIAYMRQIGPYGANNVLLMQKLKQWAISRDLLTETSIILGVAHDDPNITPPEKCRYDCCIVLSEGYELDNDMCEGVMPGGSYAVFPVEYTAENIQKAWNDIFTVWLPESGYQIDERPVFERYTGSDVDIEPDFTEICIPLK